MFRSTAPPSLRPTETPRRGESRVRARERVEHEMPAGVRAALAVDAVELAAARQAPALATRAVGPSPRASAACGPCPGGASDPPAARVRIRPRKPWVRARLRSWAGRCASSREHGVEGCGAARRPGYKIAAAVPRAQPCGTPLRDGSRARLRALAGDRPRLFARFAGAVPKGPADPLLERVYTRSRRGQRTPNRPSLLLRQSRDRWP